MIEVDTLSLDRSRAKEVPTSPSPGKVVPINPKVL